MEEMLDLALKRISDLEKRIEMYYKILYAYNELDFVMRGTYILDSDLDEIINGTYTTD